MHRLDQHILPFQARQIDVAVQIFPQILERQSRFVVPDVFLEIAVEARRPLEAQDPIILAMRYVGDGRYAGAAEALRAGQWDMRLTVANEGSAAHFTRRIYVQ